MKKRIVILCIALFTIALTQGQENDENKFSLVKGDKNLKEKLHIKLKDGKKPIIYVDGKIFEFPLDLIDPNKIESVSILEGKAAKKKFGTTDGVIYIITKKESNTKHSMKLTDDDISSVVDDAQKPKIFIDGKISNEEVLRSLKPQDIEKIDVIKGEKAIKKYNAPNGVVLITTKKK